MCVCGGGVTFSRDVKLNYNIRHPPTQSRWKKIFARHFMSMMTKIMLFIKWGLGLKPTDFCLMLTRNKES